LAIRRRRASGAKLACKPFDTKGDPAAANKKQRSSASKASAAGQSCRSSGSMSSNKRPADTNVGAGSHPAHTPSAHAVTLSIAISNDASPTRPFSRLLND
jgi:hypothetical protein